MEIRVGHAAELESLRLELELELVEERRSLDQDKFELQRRFAPGSAPGEILDQNH
jgi:hypothetical protein